MGMASPCKQYKAQKHLEQLLPINNTNAPEAHRNPKDGTEALFSSHQNQKSFQNSSSHRILRHMHEALNIDENKN